MNTITGINNYDFLKFLQSAEKKLLALRELYKQDLIEANVYVKKTELIAHSIIKVTGKDVSELITEKKKIFMLNLKAILKVKRNQ